MVELSDKQKARILRLAKIADEGELGIAELLEELFERIELAKGDKGDKGEQGDPGESVMGPRGPKGEKGDSISGPPGKDGKDGESITGPPGKDGNNGSPDTPEQIRDKLSSLEGDERLDKSAIKGLDEALKSIGTRPVYSIFGGSNGGKIVRYHDLSGSLNGSTKEFSLPAFWRVIAVHSSSRPWIFRPTTDYTTDASTMKITFTSEIDETQTLAAGQSLIVIYAEP